MNVKTQAWIVFLILFLFFIGFFFLSIPYYSGDVKNHIVWGRSIVVEGPKGFYGREFHDYSFPNYPPISMLSFAGSVLLHDFLVNLITNLDNIKFFPTILVKWITGENVGVSFLKIPAILPFILTGLIIFFFGKLLKKSFKTSIFSMLIFLLNPSLIYLAVIWGQNDFSQVLFILAAIFFLLRENFFLAYFSAGFSILSKQTVLLIWGLFLLTLLRLYGISRTIICLLISGVLLWIFYLPFNETSIIWPFSFYDETLRTTGLLVADNALNYWGLLSRFRPSGALEVIYFLSLETWGFIFFGVLFIPILYKYLTTKFSKEFFFYFLFLTSVVYFFSLTRMHERYLIFAIVFAQILTMVKKRHLFNLVFFSTFFFLNLYKGLLMPNIPILVTPVKSLPFLALTTLSYLIILAYNYYYFMFKLNNEKN